VKCSRTASGGGLPLQWNSTVEEVDLSEDAIDV
jgi:hypothetical protein